MSLALKARQRARRKGGSRERLFGCDLQEHLQRSGQDGPGARRCCTEFVEQHGVVDGIYRLSGVSSNTQRLRSPGPGAGRLPAGRSLRQLPVQGLLPRAAQPPAHLPALRQVRRESLSLHVPRVSPGRRVAPSPRCPHRTPWPSRWRRRGW
uniref:Uncharacterized protein n=1 Tax=Geospiza parvula TaxID=87175 RepID=A0A8C3Q5S7_GEOPR